MSKLLTVPEVAIKLRVSRGMVFGLVASGALPHVRVGRKCVRIEESAVEEYVNRSRRGGVEGSPCTR